MVKTWIAPSLVARAALVPSGAAAQAEGAAGGATERDGVKRGRPASPLEEAGGAGAEREDPGRAVLGGQRRQISRDVDRGGRAAAAVEGDGGAARQIPDAAGAIGTRRGE